jgi:hypothetical protein
MWRRFLVTMSFVAGIGLQLAAGLAASEPSRLEVESRSSWATPAQPEVHLLLRNPTDDEVVFTLWLGAIPGKSEVRCARQVTDVDPDFLSRFYYWNGISNGPTRGVVPPKGWTHRSLIVGESGGVAPCDVPYRLEIERGKDEIAEVIEGSVRVERPGLPQRGEVSNSGIEWSSVVERDRLYEPRLIARLLVTNRESHPIWVLLDDRRLSCSEGEPATWALHHATVQGEDVGPYELAPGGWAVFTAAVNVPKSTRPESCRASMEIVADTPAGLRPVRAAEFPLAPVGFSDAATKGRR